MTRAWNFSAGPAAMPEAVLQQALGQKLVAETRQQVEPKLKALEGVMGSKLRAAVGEPGASKPAAPKASGPTKK